ncbi:hypothetical protein HID58_071773 [Brassica napus]|uniref:Uncharacterized protein n=1 Tax=Brassica napus TaxID=3708 RepID=A0ABQ7Z2J2_BRANA|nr:hypothetical protein HID58_071773 [Brassica napus]
MRMTLQELSKDPIAQRSCLQLERAPVVSAEMNKDRGRVFDFSRVNTEAVHDTAESSSHGLLRQPERREIGVASEGIENEQIRRMGDPGIEAQRERINETLPMSHHQKDDGYIADKEEGLQLDAEGNGGFVMGSGFLGKADRSRNSRKQINKLRRELEEEETKRFPILARIMEIKLQLTQLYQEEETFWKQKCKNKCMVVGDLNTKVFHGWAKTRKMKNLIPSLTDSGGVE